jgi:hypothetical protein
MPKTASQGFDCPLKGAFDSVSCPSPARLGTIWRRASGGQCVECEPLAQELGRFVFISLHIVSLRLWFAKRPSARRRRHWRGLGSIGKGILDVHPIGFRTRNVWSRHGSRRRQHRGSRLTRPDDRSGDASRRPPGARPPTWRLLCPNTRSGAWVCLANIPTAPRITDGRVLHLQGEDGMMQC